MKLVCSWILVFALLYGCLAKENTQESSNTEDEKLDIKPRAYYPPSECRSYTMLHGADRAMANTAQNALRCDKNEFPGNLWYRFTGQAGNAMPTSCVLEKRCGTHAPGWMVGAHPTVAQGMVTRKVCYHWTKNCCRWSNYIKVRNCGAFYVYQLPKTPVCWLRYCGNGILQPPGKKHPSLLLAAPLK
ncbi:pancreatic secretory granule membrane major glycoprotein GP2-like [Nematostella vectensis]|uniref:pancreatic secretory granule membrane major glycoprotein GP2-like n=1 Tax=Nematostella vectensis TaxID=45351 RepID=UPI0020773DBC|nr:pancreatic secretory granule membrane major glycoprotein GP2-like [Nematostella vectensis]